MLKSKSRASSCLFKTWKKFILPIKYENIDWMDTNNELTFELTSEGTFILSSFVQNKL